MTPKTDFCAIARQFIGYGLSPIPVASNKKPTCGDGWQKYCSEPMSGDDVDLYFEDAWGVGLACGTGAGNLVCLDLDVKGFTESHVLAFGKALGDALMKADPAMAAKIRHAPRETSKSGGKHRYVRIDLDGNPCPRNSKLVTLRLIDDDGVIKTDEKDRPIPWCILETRGQGGQTVACPSPGYTRDTASPNWLDAIPILSWMEWNTFLKVCDQLDERALIAPNREVSTHAPQRELEDGEVLPGTDYNSKTDLGKLIEEYGWTYVGEGPRGSSWLRPDSAVPSTSRSSATLLPADANRPQLLYIFSSNAGPLDAESAYSAFAVLALYQHDGDFSATAKALAGLGFGQAATWKASHFVPSVASTFRLIGGKVFKAVERKGETELLPVTTTAPYIRCDGVDRDGIMTSRVVWTKASNTHVRRSIPLRQLADARQLLDLAALGFDITSSTASRVVDYIAELRAEHRERIPVEEVLTTSGWHTVGKNKERVFAIGTDCLIRARVDEVFDIRVQPAEGDLEVYKYLGSKGTLECWVERMNTLRDYPLMAFGVAASLSAPFLREVFDLNGNPVIEYAGESSKGKTCALQGAASVWGDPGEAPRLIRQWNGTNYAIQRMLSQLQDLPSFLDESTSASDLKTAELIYGYANGQGKAQGKADGGLRDIVKYRGVLFSTSEKSLVTATTTDGIHARTFLFSAPPLGADNYDFAVDFKMSIADHFGFAGPALVDQFLVNSDVHTRALKDYWGRCRLHYGKMASTDLERRKVESFAAFGAVLKWAIPILGLAWNANKIMDGAWASLAGQTQRYHHVEAMESLKGWCVSNQHRFEGLRDRHSNQAIAGRAFDKDGETAFNQDEIATYAIISDEAEKVLKLAGHDFKSVAPYWKRLSMIECGAERHVKRVRIGGTLTYCIYLSPTVFEGDC